MQKTFKNQQGREFLLLDLPSDAGEIHYDQATCALMWDNGFTYLSTGNYQILCLAKDATEEQAKRIVREVYTANDVPNLYENYNDDFHLDTAKESLTSLLTSLGFKQDDNVLILEKI